MKTLRMLAVATVLTGIAGLAQADQPHMRDALESLKQARSSVEAATADKGGHRGKAVDLIDQAIKEVMAGIEFDEAHGKPEAK